MHLTLRKSFGREGKFLSWVSKKSLKQHVFTCFLGSTFGKRDTESVALTLRLHAYFWAVFGRLFLCGSLLWIFSDQDKQGGNLTDCKEVTKQCPGPWPRRGRQGRHGRRFRTPTRPYRLWAAVDWSARNSAALPFPYIRSLNNFWDRSVHS